MQIHMRRVSEKSTVALPYVLVCSSCFKEYGRVSAEELQAMQLDPNYHVGVCFDCENELASLLKEDAQNTKSCGLYPTLTITKYVVATEEERRQARALGFI